jgi:hypothetical protein
VKAVNLFPSGDVKSMTTTKFVRKLLFMANEDTRTMKMRLCVKSQACSKSPHAV